MESQQLKPVKIKLNNGTASGMYILLREDEIRFTKDGETRAPNRIYKIEVAVETVNRNKRCRGKQSFVIPKGTSIVKAVVSLLGKKAEMIKTLKAKGTLKVEKVKVIKEDPLDRTLKTLFEIWINNKSINSKPNTIRTYKVVFNTHLKPLWKKNIDEITEQDIQILINKMLNKKMKPNTIKSAKRVLKPLLEINDVNLNWKKIEIPKDESNRKYTKSYDDTVKIVNALNKYPHIIANGVFKFLLTGRRLTETLYLQYENLNYENNTFTIPKELAKTKKDFTFNLTPILIQAIKSQKTNSGRIFRMEQRQMLTHFKTAMASIGIYDMVLHDIRSMVAQTALDHGANIYDVSKMLAHQKVATTESRYVEGGAKQASNAQEIFSSTAKLELIEDIEAVEIIEDKFSQIKKLYPNASDDKIKEAIALLEDL